MTVISPYITLVDRNGKLTPEGVRLLQSFVARDAALESGSPTVDARLDALETTTAGHTSDISDLIADVAAIEAELATMITANTGTAVGASGAAVTLTLAAPGAGLKHYLTYLAVDRFAAATLTAGAAPVTVTTTNLPGSLAFSFAADAAAQGTLDRWREDFAFPIAASALNTATTIVCPATTGVIWRVTAGFYTAA